MTRCGGSTRESLFPRTDTVRLCHEQIVRSLLYGWRRSVCFSARRGVLAVRHEGQAHFLNTIGERLFGSFTILYIVSFGAVGIPRRGRTDRFSLAAAFSANMSFFSRALRLPRACPALPHASSPRLQISLAPGEGPASIASRRKERVTILLIFLLLFRLESAPHHREENDRKALLKDSLYRRLNSIFPLFSEKWS